MAKRTRAATPRRPRTRRPRTRATTPAKRLEQARARERAARAALEECTRHVEAHDAQAERARTAREGLAEARDAGEDCPTCGQPWAEARAGRAQAIAAWEEKVAEERPPGEAARESARSAQAQAKERAAGAARAVEEASAARDAADAKEAQTRENARAARAALADTDVRANEHALAVTLGKIEAERARRAEIEAGTREPDAALVEASRAAVEAAEAEVAATQAKRAVRTLYARAQHEHEQATQWARIAQELGPESGLRARAQARALEGLQGWIQRVRALAGMAEVRIADGDVLWNGLPVGLASATERWVARTVVRIAICTRNRSPVCVVDGADRMVEPWRGRMRAACGEIAAKTGIAIVWTEAVGEAPAGVVAD